MIILNTISSQPLCHNGRDHGARRRQRGITLIMSLLLLLLLTILGVTAINVSTLQEKMSGNLRDQDVAFQAAESALRFGEFAINQMWLTGKPTPISVSSCGSTGCAWDTGATNPLDDTWWSANRLEYGGSGKQLPEVSADPFFVIEHLAHVEDSGHRGDRYGAPPGMQYYRITSRGQGITPFSEAIMESTYKIQFNN